MFLLEIWRYFVIEQPRVKIIHCAAIIKRTFPASKAFKKAVMTWHIKKISGCLTMSRCSRYFWILQDALDFLGFLLVIVYFDFRETVVYLPRGALTPPRFGGKFKIVNSALLARVKKIGMIQGSLNWTLQHSILSNSALGSCTVTLDWRFWPSTATFCSVLPTISRSGNTFWLAVLRIFCFSSPWSVIMSNVSVP